MLWSILFYGEPLRAQPAATLLDTVTLSVSTTLTALPGDTVVIPVDLNRGGNDIAALGAAIKATNGILSYVDYTQGPIIPGALFSVNAPAPDSVRIAFADFGGGPIVDDGILVFLRFVVDSTAQIGDSSVFRFSDLSAADPNFNNLPILGLSGKLSISLPPAEIHGMKWHDLDADGVKDIDEPGLAGWVIQLSGDTTLSATTDSSGSYGFFNLNPGNYTISEQLQSGWNQSYPPGGVYNVSLSSGETIDTLDFGNYLYGAIHGMKWYDMDSDGIKDANEPGLPNWTIVLSGDSQDTTYTDANGFYWFMDLMPGSYTVSEVLPPDSAWVQTFPPSGYYDVVLYSGDTVDSLFFGNDSVPEAIEPDVRGGIPSQYELYQNYPNPFNPVTRIRFALPKAGEVRLDIFNMLGEKVKTLVHGRKTAGYYTVEFDAGSLPSGVYFYRLQAGSTIVKVRKMVLLK